MRSSRINSAASSRATCAGEAFVAAAFGDSDGFTGFDGDDDGDDAQPNNPTVSATPTIATNC
jgi:hypothetical protein